MTPQGGCSHYRAVITFTQPQLFLYSLNQVWFNVKWILKLFGDCFDPTTHTNLNDLNRKALSGLISNLISFTFCRKYIFFYIWTFHTICTRAPCQLHIADTSIFITNSRSSAGVGNALEGGRGRAGTKLFQDFQMLSRIWTHPWCLQLDYISKENRVGWRKLSPNCAKCWFKNWESIRLIGSVDRPCTSGSDPYQCCNKIFPYALFLLPTIQHQQHIVDVYIVVQESWG